MHFRSHPAIRRNIFDPDEFGRRVRAKLDTDALSFRKAASMVPCAAQTLHRIAGGRVPDVENYLRISRWLLRENIPLARERVATIVTEGCNASPCPDQTSWEDALRKADAIMEIAFHEFSIPTW